MLRAMMTSRMQLRSGSNPHAAENHGCSYAWALLPRVLLATAWSRRRFLPGLPVVRCRVQVRLGNHETHAARGACQAGNHCPAQPYAGKAAYVDPAGAAVEAGACLAISREQHQHVV